MERLRLRTFLLLLFLGFSANCLGQNPEAIQSRVDRCFGEWKKFETASRWQEAKAGVMGMNGFMVDPDVPAERQKRDARLIKVALDTVRGTVRLGDGNLVYVIDLGDAYAVAFKPNPEPLRLSSTYDAVVFMWKADLKVFSVMGSS